jgi:DNA-binding Lrp family transcriptional regulator
MTDKLADVWRSRDYPVLLEVARRIDAGERAIPFEDVAHSLGRSADEVQLALHALKRRGLIEGIGVDVVEIVRIMDISAEAYLLTGLHPAGDDALTGLIDALRQAADLEPDADEKSRLRRAADSLGGISRNVAGGVLTAWLTHQIPGTS